MSDLRRGFHHDIDTAREELAHLAASVTELIPRATAVLLDGDLEGADYLIRGDDEIDARSLDLEELCYRIIALQAPVATDLRMVISAMRIATTMERMGDLAQHVAKTARMRYPDAAIPGQVQEEFREMAQIADRMGAKMAEVLASKDVDLAREIENDDDRMDALHRRVLDILLGDAPGPVNQAVDVTLLNRYYERYADHVVSVARRVIYLVIGARSDAS
jgi:phosphate transport system protein